MDPEHPLEDPGAEATDGPLSPSSQIGRAAQSGGTQEARRGIDDDPGDDPERWQEVRETVGEEGRPS